jgi:hypothetical protein
MPKYTVPVTNTSYIEVDAADEKAALKAASRAMGHLLAGNRPEVGREVNWNQTGWETIGEVYPSE